jgi:hypothetical protein
MKPLPAKYLFSGLFWAILVLLTGCKSKEREEPKPPVVMNSFSMRVNDQEWKPFQSKEDPCSSTYAGLASGSNENPFYVIFAHRDPTGRADAYSENLLRLQVMNVTKPGTYLLDGTYKENFDSYIIFVTQRPKHARYVNMPSRWPFVVNVTAITNWKKLVIPGIKGSFSGVLYNEADPSDSLVIEKGEFNFYTMGARSDLHCAF